jgi:hypothetical protein
VTSGVVFWEAGTISQANRLSKKIDLTAFANEPPRNWAHSLLDAVAPAQMHCATTENGLFEIAFVKVSVGKLGIVLKIYD